MVDTPRMVKVGTPILTHTMGLLQVRSTYWTSRDPREPLVVLGSPSDAAAPPLLVVSLSYARRLLGLRGRGKYAPRARREVQ